MQIMFSQWPRVPTKVDRPDIFSVLSHEMCYQCFVRSVGRVKLSGSQSRGRRGGFRHVEGSGTFVIGLALEFKLQTLLLFRLLREESQDFQPSRFLLELHAQN